MYWIMRWCSLVLLSTLIIPWATEGKVVNSFHECSQFFCNGEEPFLFKIIKPKRICQYYRSQFHFATAYSTDLRIPLYSAYRAKTISCEKDRRPNFFFIEPQLDRPDSSDEMSMEQGVENNQALNSDYRNKSYERGHLFPFSFNPGSGKASCTLTNVVPMTRQWNTKWFHFAEKIIKNMMCPPLTTLFVITGAIPSDKFLNERVNIPRGVYSYFSCCSNDSDHRNKPKKKSLKSGGYILQETGMTLITLNELEKLFDESIEVNPKWSEAGRA
ncbi:endonuclease domain-containing 1 protein-like [Chiloscyllium plagiosum]|uniref:endonuclease domain-containing 1 protein-like n=1 Tax=Chiloscyllium plagiosum TaxID=36176 RepID=UPI001CB7B454|nr:endonuclease domain-containing 1 protein-like [Chiloscyllium plagiosum]